MAQLEKAATARTSSDFADVTADTPSKLEWTGRVISGIIALFLLVNAIAMVLKTDTAVEGGLELGYPEGAVVGIGLALLASTILYAVPRTAILGALLLTGYFGGAVATHVSADDPWYVISPVIVCALIWAALGLRNYPIRMLVTR